MRINVPVRHIDSTYNIPVLSDYLNVKFTFEYVMQIDGELTKVEAKRVLYWAGKMYDNSKGINEAVLLNLSRGVKSGLL